MEKRLSGINFPYQAGLYDLLPVENPFRWAFTDCWGVAGTIISLTGWVSEIFGSDSGEWISTTGMVVFILSEIEFFGGIFIAYLYSMLPSGQ